MHNSIMVNIRCTPTTKNRLDRIAEIQDRKISAVIRRLVDTEFSKICPHLHTVIDTTGSRSFDPQVGPVDNLQQRLICVDCGSELPDPDPEPDPDPFHLTPTF